MSRTTMRPDPTFLHICTFQIAKTVSNNGQIPLLVLDQLSMLKSLLLSDEDEKSESSYSIFNVIGFHILTQALIKFSLSTEVKYSFKKEVVEQYMEFIEKRLIQSQTIPWITGYSIFQAILLYILNFSTITKLRMVAEGQNFSEHLSRGCRILRTISSKFVGLANHAKLVQDLEKMLASPVAIKNPNIDFLDCSALYEICRTALQSVGIEAGSHNNR